MIEDRITLVEEILSEFRNELNHDYSGYKNHVYRMIHFCFALSNFTDEEREKILIAACFHDLGIWTANTFDYLLPSMALAAEYLQQKRLADWITDIQLMIDQHHRLRKFPIASYPLVEVFRKGDLVDFSLGILKCGVSSQYVRAVKARFPNAGFHKRILQLAGRWFCRHPLNPLPVVKW
jgi:predicted metal-dependent HD superfamily phosphohydrolase